LSLRGFVLMLQSSFPDGVAFDQFSSQENGLAAPEVDVSEGDIFQDRVVAAMIVVLDEAINVASRSPDRSSFSSRMRFLSV
jgi:hypothetical protein